MRNTQPEQMFPVLNRDRTLIVAVGKSQTDQEEAHALQQTASLFDHLIGTGKQRRWKVEAEQSGGLEVEEQIVFRRLLHW